MSKQQPKWQEAAKRAFDIAVSLLGLVTLSPLLLAIAAGIRVGSPGPIFYRGVRTGRFNRPFRIYKFRTMVVDAERLGGPTTGQNDPRTTPIGRVLRDYKLDELPQLINVLRGDMSLVGPRPEVEEYTRRFTAEEQRILSVRPGMTDLSSIEFHDLQAHVGSKEPDRVFEERILPRKNSLRLKYVDQQSFLGDLKILLHTFVVLLTKSVRRMF